MQIKGCAVSSIHEAQELHADLLSKSKDVRSGILVGKQQGNNLKLSSREKDLIHNHYPDAERIETEALHFPRLLKSSPGVDTIVYRIGENVIVNVDGVDEAVLQVDAFICGVIDNQFHAFLRGNFYPEKEDDDGVQEIYCYNLRTWIIQIIIFSLILCGNPCQ